MKLSISNGWNSFLVLLFSQAFSLLGTGMTRFALLVWAYQQEGTATAIALLGFSATITYVLVSPFAGVLVDRWDRRRVMVLGDLGAGLMTAWILGLYLAGDLQVWHLYLAEGLAGAFEAFQEPAFSAAVSLVAPRHAYTRANSLLGLGKSAARLLAPALAGVMQHAAGLGAVMGFDLATMALAVGSLMMVRIPKPEQSETGRQAGGGFRKEIAFGIKYIWNRPGLRGLLFTFFLVNLFSTLTYFAVMPAMILARTGGNELALGTVRAAMGIGGIAGGVILSIWGGSQRKARTYLISTAASFFVCDALMGTGRSTWGWAAAGFLSEVSIPFIVSPYYALWQEKVPADVQGRVFATREMTQVSASPFGYLAGGWLADRLFEPALLPGGWLAGSVGLIVGTGVGAGMSAMFLCTSLLGGLAGLLGLMSRSILALDEPSGELNGREVLSS